MKKVQIRLFLKSDYPEFYTKSEKAITNSISHKFYNLHLISSQKWSNKDQKVGKNDILKMPPMWWNDFFTTWKTMSNFPIILTMAFENCPDSKYIIILTLRSKISGVRKFSLFNSFFELQILARHWAIQDSCSFCEKKLWTSANTGNGPTFFPITMCILNCSISN